MSIARIDELAHLCAKAATEVWCGEMSREGNYGRVARAITPIISRHIDGEWIAVSERLPEPGVTVMVYVRCENWTSDGIELDQRHKDSGFWLTFHDDKISHWRPLPSAPPRKVGEK